MSLTTALLASLALQLPLQDLTVRVDPQEVEVSVDGSSTVQARVTDPSGQVVTGVRLVWLAVTGDIVSVTQAGVITGLRPGKGQVAAVVPAADGTAAAVGFVEVLVPALPPSSLAVASPVREIPSGASVPLELRGTDRFGDAVDVAGARFTSSDEEVARVDPSGRVFARRTGQVTIRAEVGGVRATAELRVTDGSETEWSLLTPEEGAHRTGDVLRFSVRGRRGTAGSEIAGYPAWSVSGPGASIEAEGAEGVFVAEEPGAYRITALVGERVVHSALVTVTERTSESRLVQMGRGAIASHHSGDMWVFEGADGRDYVYVGTYQHDWMKVFDVTDPANTVLTDSLQLDARRINDVKIHPNARLGIVTREGASNRQNGIVFLDLGAPGHPKVISQYTETVTGGVHNVWIDGERDLLYAIHNGTSDVHILDISDPAQVSEVGRWGLEKTGKTLHDIIVQDGYAYLSYWNDGVVMLDVGAGTHGGTPTEPTFVSQYAYPIGNTHVAWRHGKYLFVGDEIFPSDWNADRPIEARGYIHVVDYSDIEHPTEVARYEVPEAGAHNVWIEDDLLYVGYYQGGLRVVDISGELRGDLYAQGRELAVFKTTDANTTVANWPMTWGAQIHKGNVYSSDLNSGLWITRLETKPRVVF